MPRVKKIGITVLMALLLLADAKTAVILVEKMVPPYEQEEFERARKNLWLVNKGVWREDEGGEEEDGDEVGKEDDEVGKKEEIEKEGKKSRRRRGELAARMGWDCSFVLSAEKTLEACKETTYTDTLEDQERDLEMMKEKLSMYVFEYVVRRYQDDEKVDWIVDDGDFKLEWLGL